VNFQKAIKQHQGGTGLWFLESEQFSRWKIDAASFLWLYGIPGCGKTVLSSTVLQTLLGYCQEDIGKVVAYFYFDFTDPRKQDTELMIYSLISQLSQQCVQIPAALETLFSSCGKGGERPSLNAALKVLQEMILEFPQIYFVLDALDECSNRVELMEILQWIEAWKTEKLHILITSRKERDIESSVQSFIGKQHMICLQNRLVDPDIQTYIQQRLLNDNKLEKWRKENKIREEIETVLIKGAHGMYEIYFCPAS
jgi:Cdc6-like AAA superfamily ATPase